MNTIELIGERSLNRSKAIFQDIFEKQGHNLTGATSNSWFVDIRKSSDVIEFRVFISKVAVIQHYGIKKENIPYGGSLGTGGRSIYIQKLKEYGQKRKGLNDKESLQFAFAVAKIHKREGMQTENSKRYSRTGERKGFLNNVFNHVPADIEMAVNSEVQSIFNQSR